MKRVLIVVFLLLLLLAAAQAAPSGTIGPERLTAQAAAAAGECPARPGGAVFP